MGISSSSSVAADDQGGQVPAPAGELNAQRSSRAAEALPRAGVNAREETAAAASSAATAAPGETSAGAFVVRSPHKDFLAIKRDLQLLYKCPATSVEVHLVADKKDSASESTVMKVVGKDKGTEFKNREAYFHWKLSSFGHLNIVRALSFYTFDTTYALELEYCQLLDLDECPKEVTVAGRYWLLKDALRGLEFLHGKKLVHCDLKLQNIGLQMNSDGTMVAKLMDFGAARKVGFQYPIGRNFGCTQGFRPPETYYENLPVERHGEDSYSLTPAFDMWSLGVIVVRFFGSCTTPPFLQATKADSGFESVHGFLENYQEGVVIPFRSLTKPLPHHVTANILPGLLRLKPEDRWTSEQALQSVRSVVKQIGVKNTDILARRCR